MSDPAIIDILRFNKNDVKLAVRSRIITRRPETLSFLSSKVVNDATTYLRGYADALVEHIEQPYNNKEIREFLYDRAYEYVIYRAYKEI